MVLLKMIYMKAFIYLKKFTFVLFILFSINLNAVEEKKFYHIMKIIKEIFLGELSKTIIKIRTLL